MNTDLKAAQKWSNIPTHIQERIISSIFCSSCGATTIIEYSMYNDKFGVLLKGKCKNAVMR